MRFMAGHTGVIFMNRIMEIVFRKKKHVLVAPGTYPKYSIRQFHILGKLVINVASLAFLFRKGLMIKLPFSFLEERGMAVQTPLLLFPILRIRRQGGQ
jgi:hypothetical protein